MGVVAKPESGYSVCFVFAGLKKVVAKIGKKAHQITRL
jgi:hypothetical protein